MFDIGVNLTSLLFAKDNHQVITRARDASVTGMLITGTDTEQSQAAFALTAKYSGYCWSTAGVHPHNASCWQASIEQQIRILAANPSVVAIGECGLDSNRNFSTPVEQEIAFSAQLALAAELSPPVFLHGRDVYERFIALLSPWLDKIPAAVVHCFTGTGDELDAFLALGLSIGITGLVCDERRGLELRALLPLIPAQQLLLETDAPYLLPRDLHPKPASRRNEPCFLPHIVRQVAVWREEDPTLLGQKSDENARRIFRLV